MSFRGGNRGGGRGGGGGGFRGGGRGGGRGGFNQSFGPPESVLGIVIIYLSSIFVHDPYTDHYYSMT